MVVNKYVLILCRISTRLAVRSLLFENKMKDKTCMHRIMRMSFLLPSMKLCHISNAVP